jgi:hypothetical protein
MNSLLPKSEFVELFLCVVFLTLANVFFLKTFSKVILLCFYFVNVFFVANAFRGWVHYITQLHGHVPQERGRIQVWAGKINPKEVDFLN